MNEVQNLKDSYDLTTVYELAYEKRFGLKPILNPNGGDATIIKDLSRQLGKIRAQEIIEHYLTMDDDWFQQKGYDLHTLKTSLARINASLGESRLKKSNPKTPIRSSITCDACGKSTWATLPVGYDFNQKTMCEECDIYR